MTITPLLVVHGGAAIFESERHRGAEAGCVAAAQAGLAVLASGGAALDAVIAAVHVLEDCPDLNAGLGAVLTRAETVELDAGIMDGNGLRFGGVAAMPATRHPIDVARLVMDDGEHVLLCAEGARAFAVEHGVPLCDPAELITERARLRVTAERARRHVIQPDPPAPRAADPGALDPGTVGACAIDAAGHVAAATSTGGVTYKRIGRIGDTPLCGCGTYADDRGGAASATGVGEGLIRTTVTRRCVDLLRAGLDATSAAERAIAELGEDVGGLGGIIVCDAAGRVGGAHSTEHMAHAAARMVDGRPHVIAGMSLPQKAGAGDLMARLLARA